VKYTGVCVVLRIEQFLTYESDDPKCVKHKKMTQIKIIGITDGDPFDKTTWSGSSSAFFEAVKKQGCLHAGISGLPSSLINRFFQVINYCPSKEAWKFKCHIDTRYYRAYTRRVQQGLASLKGGYTHTLQIYSHYDVPSIITDKSIVKCAYQDGNLACFLGSPRGYPQISQKRIDRAMAWEKKVFGGLDIIFTFSEWLRQSFINDYNIAPDRVVVVGAGANIPVPDDCDKKEFDGKMILFIGIDFARKGGKVLLEAFQQVKKVISDARLKVIGPLSLHGLPDGVENLGFISKMTSEGIDRLRQAYLEASLFVMPSLYEPYGVVFLEAMAHGLPCVGADNCAMPEIIDHGKTGFLVPPGDAEALAERMVELLQDKELAATMGNRGRDKFVNSMKWDHVAERVVECLHERM